MCELGRAQFEEKNQGFLYNFLDTLSFLLPHASSDLEKARNTNKGLHHKIY